MYNVYICTMYTLGTIYTLYHNTGTVNTIKLYTVIQPKGKEKESPSMKSGGKQAESSGLRQAEPPPPTMMRWEDV